VHFGSLPVAKGDAQRHGSFHGILMEHGILSRISHKLAFHGCALSVARPTHQRSIRLLPQSNFGDSVFERIDLGAWAPMDHAVTAQV
jgi:hypothetical protein